MGNFFAGRILFINALFVLLWLQACAVTNPLLRRKLKKSSPDPTIFDPQTDPGNQSRPPEPAPSSNQIVEDAENDSFNKYVEKGGLIPHMIPAPDKRILDVLSHLGASLENEKLSYKGKLYSPIEYDTKLEFDLHLKLRDPVKASTIYEVYKREIARRVLSVKLKNRLAEWLVEVSNYLGSDSYYLVNSNEISDFEDLVKAEREPLVLSSKSIITEVASKFGNQTGQLDPELVAILTTISGGGHYSVAKALDSKLKVAGYKPQMIVVDGFGDADPFFKLTGNPSGVIFNEINQKKGDIELFNNYMLFIHWYLHYFFQNYENKVIRESFQATRPLAVINTMGYTDAYVSSAFEMNIPQLLVSTDFDIWSSLDPVIQKSTDALVRVGIPSKNKEVLDLFLSRHGDKSFAKAVKDFSTSRDSNFARNLVPYLLGYPTREEIFIQQASEQSKTRQELGLKATDQVVLVMMGSQGKSSLYEVVSSLEKGFRSETSVPKIFVFAGNNEEAKDRLGGMISKYSDQMIKNIKVLGFQSAEQMNDYYNIADVMISKPGGATTAEVLAVQLPMVMFDINEGEKQNKAYMESSGLGEFAADTEELVVITKKFLDDRPQLGKEFKPFDWHKGLNDFLDYSKKHQEIHKVNQKNNPDFYGVTVQSKDSFTFGRFDYYAYLTEVSGTVSGFFLYPKNKVENKDHHEFDIELRGGVRPHLQTNHWVDGKPAEQVHQLKNPLIFKKKQKFSIEWSPETITFYHNDQLLRISPNAYHQPLHLFTNFWALDDLSWVGPIVKKQWNFVHCMYVEKMVYTPWNEDTKQFSGQARTLNFSDLEEWNLHDGYYLGQTQMKRDLASTSLKDGERYLTLKLLKSVNLQSRKKFGCVDHVH